MATGNEEISNPNMTPIDGEQQVMSRPNVVSAQTAFEETPNQGLVNGVQRSDPRSVPPSGPFGSGW